jgi:hypothetical protein
VQLQHTLVHQLVVENRTRSVLEILDEDGVPFGSDRRRRSEPRGRGLVSHGVAEDAPLPAGVGDGQRSRAGCS